MTTNRCRLDPLEVFDAGGFGLGGPGARRKLFVVRDEGGVHGPCVGESLTPAAVAVGGGDIVLLD